MTGWLNTHSYFLLILAILGLALISTLAINRVWLRGLVLVFVIVLLIAGYLSLRNGTSTHTTQEELSSALGVGTPILLEFYSDY